MRKAIILVLVFCSVLLGAQNRGDIGQPGSVVPTDQGAKVLTSDVSLTDTNWVTVSELTYDLEAGYSYSINVTGLVTRADGGYRLRLNGTAGTTTYFVLGSPGSGIILDKNSHIASADDVGVGITGTHATGSVTVTSDGTFGIQAAQWDTDGGTSILEAGTMIKMSINSTDVTAQLNLFSKTTTLKGLVPGTNGVSPTYTLKADQSWSPESTLGTADIDFSGDRAHNAKGFAFVIDSIANLEAYGNTINLESYVGDVGITSAGNFSVNSGNVTSFSGPGSVTFNSTAGNYYYLTNPPLDNAEDQVLAFDATTKKIELRDVSTIADGLGSSPTSGAILFGQGTTTAAIDATNLFWDDANNRLGIGTNAPARDLHVLNTGNAYMLLDKGSGNYTEFREIATQLRVNNYSASGNASIDINPVASDGTSNQFFRFFRESNSTGPTYFDIFRGDGTSTVNARIGGKGVDTYFAINNGNVGIGTGSPNTYGKLDISSTTGALIVPRMTTTQRDAMTATAGMIIYNTTTGTFQGYTTSWTNL